MSITKRTNKNINEAIFELAPFPMWIYNLETYQFLAVNQEAIRQYGYTKEEFLNMTIKEIKPAEDIPLLEEAVAAARTRSDTYMQSLFRHQRKDGSIIHVKIKSNLINYEGHDAEIVTAIDLTNRYKQEKLIEEQKKYLSTIGELNQILLKSHNWVEALNQCFHVAGNALNADRVYFFQNDTTNQTISQKIEWTKNRVVTQTNSINLQNIPLDKLQTILKLIENGSPFEAIVSKLPNSPSKDILIEREAKSILVLPVMISNTFIGFIGADDCELEKEWEENDFELLKNLASNLGHIIKEEQAHKKIIDSEARFKSLVLNSTDLIGIIDEEGNYIYVAPNSAPILGISPEEFIGKNAFEFIHEEDTPRLMKCLEQLLEKKQLTIEPYRFSDAKGNWRWIQTELTNHLDNPAIRGIVANSWEVTEEIEKRKENKLLALMTKEIARPGSLSLCLTNAVKKLTKHSEASASELWLISKDKKHLNFISKSFKDETFKNFYANENATEINSLKKGKGIPGYIWTTKDTHAWDKLPSNLFERKKAAEHININTTIGVPIFYNTEFIGCFLCFYTQYRPKLFHQKLLSKIGIQIGAAIQQKITEDEYRNFFDISPDPLCVVGFDGLVKKHNKAFRKLLGYKKKEVINLSIFKFIHPEDIEESKKRLESSSKNKKGKSFEVRFITKSNEVKWLVWNGVIIPESKIFLAVAKNITEQKVAREELNTAYQRLKTAQKIAKIGYWIHNFGSEVSIWGEETYKIFGYTPENFIPTLESVKGIYHPDDRHLIKNNPTNLKSGEVKTFENRIITAKGEIRWVRQEIRLLADKTGKPYRIEGTIQDINESKEHEQKLAISNERFRLAVQASNEMIWEIDHIDKKIIRSKVYEKKFGYQLEEIYSKSNSWFNQVHPEDKKELWDSYNKAFRDKNTTFWDKEYRIFSKSGVLSYVIDRCYILRNKKGEPIRSVGSILDVTTSRKQFELIKEQNKSLREIAWAQSHAVRAPLSRIMSLINFFKEFGSEEKPIEEIFEMILDSANELDKIIYEITEKTNALNIDEKKDITY